MKRQTQHRISALRCFTAVTSDRKGAEESQFYKGKEEGKEEIGGRLREG